jgi:hypothetical protein
MKTKSEARMKVTLNGTWAGPDGTARAGTVLDLPQLRADELLKSHAARVFDKERDAKAPRGLVKPPENPKE